MACMCGDPCCPSCGPAQGNSKCPICREWVSEGCEHFFDDGDEIKLKPEYEAQAAEIAKGEAIIEAMMAVDLNPWMDND
jgi:hypothetical protein